MKVFVPSILATANIAYGLYDPHGQLITRVHVNQNDTSGWHTLADGVWDLHHVLISSNNGESGTYMAAGPMQFDTTSQ